MSHTQVNMGVINRLSYDQPCKYQLDRICDHRSATITKVVDDKSSSSVSAPSWT